VNSAISGSEEALPGDDTEYSCNNDLKYGGWLKVSSIETVLTSDMDFKAFPF